MRVQALKTLIYMKPNISLHSLDISSHMYRVIPIKTNKIVQHM